MKTELFENADATASTYDMSECMDLSGSRKGTLIVCFVLSKFEEQSLNVAASSRGREYFLMWIKKMQMLFKNIWICVDEA